MVDQSTDEKTKEIVRKHMQANKRIRYIHMDARGKTKALNLGIKESSGDIIAMTDDDCVVTKDWIEKIVEAFDRNPDVAIVFGSVVDEKTLTEKKGRKLIKDGKFTGVLSKLLFTGDAANRAVKRTVYQKIKGHDELLGVGTPLLGSEDQDFAYRALKAGFKILTVRDIIVTHYLYRIHDVKSFLSVLRGFEVGAGALYFKHVRCSDYIAILMLFKRWFGRICQLTEGILFSEKIPINKPRMLLLLYLWFVLTYWILLGVIKSLKYPIDKTYGLFLPK